MAASCLFSRSLISLRCPARATWDSTLLKKLIVDRLTVVWGVVDHLTGVKDSSELRAATEEVQRKLKFQLRLGQSKPIYNAFKAIQDSHDWKTLSDARKLTVEMDRSGKAPLEVFVEFQGREPSPEPLLRHNGLLQVASA